MEWISVKDRLPEGDLQIVITWHHTIPWEIWRATWVIDWFELYEPDRISKPPLAVDYWMVIELPKDK